MWFPRVSRLAQTSGASGGETARASEGRRASVLRGIPPVLSSRQERVDVSDEGTALHCSILRFLLSPPSLSSQVLEDKNGVFVNGLTQVPVLGWEAALDVLSQGVLNRTTASTLMNTVSSRSHAVFTITLAQTIRDEADPEGDPQVS